MSAGGEIESRIEQTSEGYWVVKGESHINGWVREHRRLDHDAVLDTLCLHITSGDIVIDVGANIGTHTCRYLKAVGKEGTVVAYEPHPVHFECLTRNCPEALCRPIAISNRHFSTFLIEEYPNTGKSFLSENPVGTYFKVVTSSLDMDLAHLGSGRRVSFIKIDVEGCELEVLEGAAKLIGKFKPKIWLEINHSALAQRGRTSREIQHLLEEKRYKYDFAIGHDWDSPYSDLLCTPLEAYV